MSDDFDHMNASAKSLKQWLVKNNGMSLVGESPSVVELKVAVVSHSTSKRDTSRPPLNSGGAHCTSG